MEDQYPFVVARVATALSQLHKELNNIVDIQKSLDNVSKDWRHSNSAIESLKYMKYAVMWHSWVTAASETLKNNLGPQIVREIHCTMDVPAGPLEAGGPGVLAPKTG